MFWQDPVQVVIFHQVTSTIRAQPIRQSLSGAWVASNLYVDRKHPEWLALGRIADFG